MGHATEHVYLHPQPNSIDSWWDRYLVSLKGITPTARSVLETDCRYIVERGVFGVGAPVEGRWLEKRVRTGLVMGSVQSGKTASMLGVSALALDQGIDIVLVLAGTRLALWRQTYERLAAQLDVGDDNAEKANRRLICPPPGIALADMPNSLKETYRMPLAQVKRKFKSDKPLVIVAMKQTDHLYALGNSLRTTVFRAVQELGRPIHMLVLDDEADDGSILDAVVEAGLDPLSSQLKQLPRAIADLWEPRSGGAPENLFTTYVGYTATPQANLLQEDHNPLAPRDFVASLRTPLDVGLPVDLSRPNAPRSSTFPEPDGIGSYYTGGQVFYERGEAANLCVELTGRPEEDLGEAVRAFLVATAIRLWREPEKLGPYSAAKEQFDSSEAALESLPGPNSMLFHPSADIDTHFAGAEDILIWAGIESRAEARELLEADASQLPIALVNKMYEEEELWQVWVERYQESSNAIATEFNVLETHVIPDWPSVKQILEEEVIPGTRVSVVNSDQNADDRPEYGPKLDEISGKWKAPRDLSTIFVSGNVMARGLTLEGLSTVLFRRTSNKPFADTQMQMQRWFGYRGKYIELCRVFASRTQLDLFASYHDTDEALREGISTQMTGEAPDPAVLHGNDFFATGKIANLGQTPLCPGPKPFVTLTNSGESLDPNEKLVAELFSSRPSSDVVVGGTLRGRALNASLSLIDAAELLEQLKYSEYMPGQDTILAVLWSQVQARVSSVTPLPDGVRLYRAPGPDSGEPSPPRLDCPYVIPAYLRLWESCLTREVRGLFVTGNPPGRWSMADLEVKQQSQPRFTVGIRFGSGSPIDQGALADLDFDIPSTQRHVVGHELATTWGTNDPTAGPSAYRGDEFFDYYHRGEDVPNLGNGVQWRPAGSDGQILFYLNQPTGQNYPVVAVGVCIPSGGPEQFAATRARRQMTV